VARRRLRDVEAELAELRVAERRQVLVARGHPHGLVVRRADRPRRAVVRLVDADRVRAVRDVLEVVPADADRADGRVVAEVVRQPLLVDLPLHRVPARVVRVRRVVVEVVLARLVERPLAVEDARGDVVVDARLVAGHRRRQEPGGVARLGRPRRRERGLRRHVLVRAPEVLQGAFRVDGRGRAGGRILVVAARGLVARAGARAFPVEPLAPRVARGRRGGVGRDVLAARGVVLAVEFRRAAVGAPEVVARFLALGPGVLAVLVAALALEATGRAPVRLRAPRERTGARHGETALRLEVVAGPGRNDVDHGLAVALVAVVLERLGRSKEWKCGLRRGAEGEGHDEALGGRHGWWWCGGRTCAFVTV